MQLLLLYKTLFPNFGKRYPPSHIPTSHFYHNTLSNLRTSSNTTKIT